MMIFKTILVSLLFQLDSHGSKIFVSVHCDRKHWILCLWFLFSWCAICIDDIKHILIGIIMLKCPKLLSQH